MTTAGASTDSVEDARRRLEEAERLLRACPDDYVLRRLRNGAVVDALRAGVSQEVVTEIADDLGSFARVEVVPGGLLGPADTIRRSGLDPEAFVEAVRSGRLPVVDLPGGVRAFGVHEVDALRSD